MTQVSEKNSAAGFTPYQLASLMLAVVILINVVIIDFKLSQPYLGLTLSTDNGTLILASDATSTNSALTAGIRIMAISANGERIALQASDLIEEPDLFPTYEEYNAFMRKQSDIYQLLNSSRITLETETGQVTLEPRKGALQDISALFWIQLFVADISLLAGMSAWQFRRHDLVVKQYALMGVFLAVTIWPAAIYSTRELAMDGMVFHLLSRINHLGTFVVMAALITLIWLHPKALTKSTPVRFFYALMLTLWLLDVLQWFPDQDTGVRLTALLALSGCLLLLFLQWRKSRSNLVDRRSIQWFSLMLVLGCAVFTVVIFIPPLLGAGPLLSQGLAFVAFLTFYFSLAIGVVYYRLFDLDRWWFNIWLWLIVGAIVTVLDIVLIYGLHLSSVVSLWLALAIAGWLYFPLRQWLLQRFLRPNQQDLNNCLPQVVRGIATADSEEDLTHSCRQCLSALFRPLQQQMEERPSSRIEILDQGLQMAIPIHANTQTLQLAYPGQGQRLFRHEDRVLADNIVQLYEQARLAIQAREAGEQEERERIKQDIHDSLSGRLLAIMHQQNEPNSAALARQAWRELRDTLAAMEGKNAPLVHVLSQWHSDIQRQCEQDDTMLDWDITNPVRDEAPEIGGLQRLHLGQIVREVTTNALRHGKAHHIRVHFDMADNHLQLKITSQGQATDPQQWQPGRGLLHVQSRAQKLDAAIGWQTQSDNRLVFTLNMPLQAALS